MPAIRIMVRLPLGGFGDDLVCGFARHFLGASRTGNWLNSSACTPRPPVSERSGLE
jgi:hypothetical protein